MSSIIVSGANILINPLVQTNTGSGNEGQGTIAINGGTSPFEADDIVVFDVQNATGDGELDGSSGITGAIVYDSFQDYLDGVPKYTYTPMNPGQEANIQNDLSGLGDSYVRFNGNVLTSSDPGAPALSEMLLTPQIDWTVTDPTSGTTINRFTDNDFNDSGAIDGGTTEDANGLYSADDWNAVVLAAADPRDFTVSGTAGNDFITRYYTGDPEGEGVDGNDAADGSNDDVIDAGAGDDIVTAGRGNDTVFGGIGDDTIGGDNLGFTIGDFASDPAVTATNLTIINSADGPIELWLIDESGTPVFFATINSGETLVQPTFEEQNWVLQDEEGRFVELIEGAPNQTVDYGAEGLDDSIDGGAGKDTLLGMFGDDTLAGGENDDLISGGSGNDSIRGDAGQDIIQGGDGDDTVYGGDDDDEISGGAGNDSIRGDAGQDIIQGGDGDDTVYGGDDDDEISGGAGNDIFVSEDGGDTMFGGTGDDTYTVTSAPTGSQSDIFDAGEDGADDGTADGDIDVIDLSALTPGVDYTISYAPVGGAVQSSNTGANPSQTSEDGVVTFSDGSTLTFSNVELIICFTRGTQIETDRGPVAIEDLSQGDLVVTKDNGLQPIRWIGSTVRTQKDLSLSPKLSPIRIAAGALGPNMPSKDLLVSPQHRMLIKSRIAERMFGEEEVLVAAKHLIGLTGIEIARQITNVEYFHFLFDQHEIVVANGAYSESLFTGPQALKSISPQARAEVFTLFPELMDVNHNPIACRPLPNKRKAQNLARRHQKNLTDLVQTQH